MVDEDGDGVDDRGEAAGGMPTMEEMMREAMADEEAEDDEELEDEDLEGEELEDEEVEELLDAEEAPEPDTAE
jgi:Sec-independent protein translocase protein TatA